MKRKEASAGSVPKPTRHNGRHLRIDVVPPSKPGEPEPDQDPRQYMELQRRNEGDCPELDHVAMMSAHREDLETVSRQS